MGRAFRPAARWSASGKVGAGFPIRRTTKKYAESEGAKYRI
jgi:hypothetical protein